MFYILIYIYIGSSNSVDTYGSCQPCYTEAPTAAPTNPPTDSPTAPPPTVSPTGPPTTAVVDVETPEPTPEPTSEPTSEPDEATTTDPDQTLVLSPASRHCWLGAPGSNSYVFNGMFMFTVSTLMLV